MYYNKSLSDAELECQASKTLAFKWFNDWKNYQKIQPDKTYAQALLLVRKRNQSSVKSGLKQNKPTIHPVSRTGTVDLNNKKSPKSKAHQTRLVKQHKNQVQVSNYRSSVTGVGKSSDIVTDGQVKLKNRFQVLQNTADHESFDDQGFHNFRLSVEKKHAKVNKKQNVAARVSDSKF